MIYSYSVLTDLGWRNSDTHEVIADIYGMDNRTDGQKFYHAGKIGYPCIDTFWTGDYGDVCFCTSGVAPVGSTIVTKAGFITAIISRGFGDGVYIGIDGAPHKDGDSVVELPDVSAENTKIIIDAQRRDNIAILRETINAMADGAEKLALQAILTILEEDSGNG